MGELPDHSPIVQPKIIPETEEHTFDSEYSLDLIT